MSAESVTEVRAAPPAVPAQPGGPDRAAEPGADPLAELADRMQPICARAVDADEVAALLEASGINDRVARQDFAVTSVFALAAALLNRTGTGGADRTALLPVTLNPALTRRFPLVDTLVRTALYLTPTVVALGAAGQVTGLPAVTTVGALVFGWGVSQALAYLGYCALGVAGRTAAARLLACGFVLAAGGWAGVLGVTGVPWPAGYVVSGAQLALFGSTAIALVTGRERTVLRCAVPCWAAAGYMAVRPGTPAVAALLAALTLMLLVAYRPVLGGRDEATGRLWSPPRPRDLLGALGYGAVGAGQGVLFVLVVLVGAHSAKLPLDAVPLLVGVPMTELLLLWHQRRVADGRATLHDRAAFEQHLVRVSRGTVAMLCLPVAIGASLCAPVMAGRALVSGHLEGLPGQSRLATAVLLTAVFALCLVLVTHRRLGTAAILVWWPAALIGLTARALPGWVHLPVNVAHWVAGLTLFAVCLPALVVVALVIRDPWSYR